jgi:predicted nucleic acid-binding protein
MKLKRCGLDPMPVLINNTVLSNLAAADCLAYLDALHDKVWVASAVYDEVQQGIAEGYEFLKSIETALDHQRLQLVTLENDAELRAYRAMPAKLHSGEAMSIAIATCRGWLFLTDDQAARAYARQIGVPISGTLGVLMKGVRSGLITLKEANTALARMQRIAHYRSPVSDLRDLI